MKKLTLTFVLVTAIIVTAHSQKATMELSFTAENNGQYIPLDSILIENLTQGGDTTLYTPDTLLVLDYITGIRNNKTMEGNSLLLTQNYPNPFKGKTAIDLYVPETEHIIITIRDILGRELVNYNNTLNRGNHSFAFYSANQKYYLLTVTGKQTSQTIKMLNANCNTAYQGKSELIYNGFMDDEIIYKSEQALNGFGFSIGDELMYTAYTDVEETQITDTPTSDQTYTFVFAGWIPCPGSGVITDIDGNTYNTIQIGPQCWLKENLKTTTYRNGLPIPNVPDTSWANLTTGAYVWYNNDNSWKDLYGALYNWHTTADSIGLCPTGWHVPTTDEWIALTDYIGGDGFPYGNELKSCRKVSSPMPGGCNTTQHPRWDQWNIYYGTNNFWFSGLPGGKRTSGFEDIGFEGSWWSSTEIAGTLARRCSMNAGWGGLWEQPCPKYIGNSVRCLRDADTSNILYVETGPVINITLNGADAEGKIIDLGGADILQHGHCWSTDPNPTIDDFKTELGPATSFATFVSNLTGLDPETTYYVRAYAINNEGVTKGDEVTFETITGGGEPCPGTPTVTDIEGNVYNTVQIGSQCWMKENLKTVTYNNGTPITNVPDSTNWVNLTTGAYVWYNNDISWKDLYGAMYNWYAVDDVNGLCPTGWHVPTKDEWLAINVYFGGWLSGKGLKSCRQINSPLSGECNTTDHPRWNEHETYFGTNEYGFSGLPAGKRNSGSFNNIGETGYWWGTTVVQSGWSYLSMLLDHSDVLTTGSNIHNGGFSVRCLKD